MRWLLTAVFTLMTTVAFAAESKIGVVDMERALFLSKAAQKSIKQFEKDNKADIDKIKSLQQELMDTRSRLDKEGDIMSDSEKRKLANSMEEKTQEFQFYGRKMKQLEEKWKRELLTAELPEMEKVLMKIIEDGNYDVVLNAGAAVFAGPKVDLTKALIEKLDAR